MIRNNYVAQWKYSVTVFLMICISTLNIDAASKDDYTSIGKLIETKSLKVDVESLGGHTGNCINMVVENLTEDYLKIWIEPGRRLVDIDAKYQDILIVKEQLLTLIPSEIKEIVVYGFCCESSKSSPRKGAKYSIGYMAPLNWIGVAEVINKGKFPTSAIQSAVWVVSDNHPISSISHTNINEIMPLRKAVGGVLGIENTWYMLTFALDTAVVFTGIHDRVIGDIDYYLRNNTLLTVVVKSPDGRVIETLVKESGMGPGKHVLNVDLNVRTWPKGKYEIVIVGDFNNQIIKRVFEL
jgi:hypothetical protein